MGYANRFVHLDFPELSEADDPIWVKIRNPRICPDDTFVTDMADRDIADVTTADALASNREVIARLVVAWHVYDARDDSDNPPPLGLPATPVLVAKLPQEITDRILAEVREARTPRKPQVADTSTTSSP